MARRGPFYYFRRGSRARTVVFVRVCVCVCMIVNNVNQRSTFGVAHAHADSEQCCRNSVLNT